MDRENHCENCGFDLSCLELTLLYARKGPSRESSTAPSAAATGCGGGARAGVPPNGDGALGALARGGRGGPSNMIPLGR
jgi:hypothetical protein